MSVETETAPPYQQALDKTLYATLSLYISSEHIESTFLNWTPETRRALQSRQRLTGELSRAIDPLFNDIAIRDRNAVVDEFLIDLDGARTVETVRITIPGEIDWETEGQRFRAELGGPVSHDIDVRSFWYVHANGALSFHLSFLLRYDHTFADFYFLSMLQKLMFPKELSQKRDEVVESICSGRTGVWALDLPTVQRLATAEGAADTPGTAATAALPFWTYVREAAGRQLTQFVKTADLQQASAPKLDDHGLWDALIACNSSSFIEIPGLEAPPARSVFLLQDAQLFELLQPSPRDALRGNPNYAPIVPREADRGSIVTISYEALPTSPVSPDHTYDPRYYFLAGFFQNIIDFFNQDLSELRDGTDPIYPRTPEQAADALFVRYANGRSLFQIVAQSRSLEVGNDYIGTCPYVFLVHLMALHNEFVVRRYEAEITDLQTKLDSSELTTHGSLRQLLAALSNESKEDRAVSSQELQRATATFYQFRLKAFTFFKRHLYDNTLRYETERDLFESLQRIRGIETRLERCESVVEGLDRTMKDLEDDKRYRDQREARQSEGRLSKLVGVVGLFSVVQASFQAVVEYRSLFEGGGNSAAPRCKFTPLGEGLISCSALTSAEVTSLALIGGTLLGVAVVGYFAARLAWQRFSGS